MKQLNLCSVLAAKVMLSGLMLSGLMFTVGCESGGGSSDPEPTAPAGNAETTSSDGGGSSSPEISMSVVSSVNDGSETTATLVMSGAHIVQGTFVDFKWETADFSSTIGPDSTTAGANGIVSITITGSFDAAGATQGIGVVYLQRDTTGDGIYDEVKGPYNESLVL